MFNPIAAFSGFSVGDLDRARRFYAETLGLHAVAEGDGLCIHLPGGGRVFIYAKPDHQPAPFTILNFVVENIDQAVDELTRRGVHFERYPSIPADEKGVARTPSGPLIAWLTDPDRNIVSVMQERT